MKASDVLDLYNALEQVGVNIWVDGGWSVDALLGKATRPHADFDMAIEWKDVPKLRVFLEAREYKQVNADSQWNFTLKDNAGHIIDVHAFVSGTDGSAVEGIMYPKGALEGTGTINGQAVRCISPQWMVKFLAPWIHKWPRKYLQAVADLCEKYDIELPEEYKNYKQNH